jgi:competence protein ComEC
MCVVFLLTLSTRWIRITSPFHQLFLFSLITIFGILKISYDAKYVTGENIARFILPGKSIELHCTIADLPQLTDRSVRFAVEAVEVLSDSQRQRATGGILITARRRDVDTTMLTFMTYGRAIVLRGELQSLRSARNPGEFDLLNYLHLNNIYARFYAERIDSSILGEEARYNFLTSCVYPVRRSVSQRLDQLIGGEEAQFLKGLVIGERSQIPLEVKNSFINAGVMHILAVSGLHVAIVAMIILVFLQLVRLPEKPRILFACIFLCYYAFLTGGTASVNRSVIMGIVFLGAKLFERKSDMYNTLALSAVFILVADAKQLFQAGFQLSFVAVFSLVYLYPKINGLKQFLPEKYKQNRIITSFIAVIAVSLAAGIGTLPFTSFYFGKISIISFVANIIIVPLSNVVLALGMLTVAVSYFSAWIAGVYAHATTFLTWCLLKLVSMFGGLPFSYIDSHFTIWSSLSFYWAIGIVVGLGRKKWRTRSIILALITLNSNLYVKIVSPSRMEPLRVTFLDVGQGDASFIEFPDGKNLLVDGGPLTTSTNAGERVIAPFLLKKGIHHLNGVLLSHPHSDHLGGIPYVLRHFTVDEVVDAGSIANSSLYREYNQCIDSIHIRHHVVSAGSTLDGFENIRLYITHPTQKTLVGDTLSHGNLNNESVVVKLIYGQSTLLLSGDSEIEAEERMIRWYGNFLHSDILKTGHHGSITSSTFEYLQEVKPRVSIVSVGERNKFHHPSPIVLERLKSFGAVSYRTDERGALVFESDGKTWSLINWH